jgi:hypothetical protein
MGVRGRLGRNLLRGQLYNPHPSFARQVAGSISIHRRDRHAGQEAAFGVPTAQAGTDPPATVERRVTAQIFSLPVLKIRHDVFCTVSHFAVITHRPVTARDTPNLPVTNSSRTRVPALLLRKRCNRWLPPT